MLIEVKVVDVDSVSPWLKVSSMPAAGYTASIVHLNRA